MTTVQIIDQQLEAFNARDIDRYVSFYSPDAVVQDGIGNVMAQGLDAIRALYGQLFAQSPNLHVEILNRIHVGAWVIDEERTTGFNFEGFPSELHAPCVYRVENGCIVKLLALI